MWEAPPAQQALQWLPSFIFRQYWSTLAQASFPEDCGGRVPDASGQWKTESSLWSKCICVSTIPHLEFHTSADGKCCCPSTAKLLSAVHFPHLRDLSFTVCRSLWFIVLWHMCCFLNGVFLWQMSLSSQRFNLCVTPVNTSGVMAQASSLLSWSARTFAVLHSPHLLQP